MNSDLLGGFLLVTGIAFWVSSLVGPAATPNYYGRVLHAWGNRKQVKIDFVLDPGQRLREGPDVEAAVGRLYTRQDRTVFIGLACVGLSYLLLMHGPHLSDSSANSLAVAFLPVLATVVAAVQLRDFAAPYRTAGGPPREARLEDYVWPATRVLAWLLAMAGLAVPVAAAVLASGPTYDGGKVFWEGLTVVPLAGVTVVVAVEWWLWRVTDESEDDDPSLYVWDCLRNRAVKFLYGFAFIDLAMAFQNARGGLNGVAQVGSEPPWLDRASAACWVLEVAAYVGFVMLAAQPLAPRLRARLWPDLPPAHRIEFGKAIQIP